MKLKLWLKAMVKWQHQLWQHLSYPCLDDEPNCFSAFYNESMEPPPNECKECLPLRRASRRSVHGAAFGISIRIEQIRSLPIEEVALHIGASPKSVAFKDHAISSQHQLPNVKIWQFAVYIEQSQKPALRCLVFNNLVDGGESCVET